MRVPEKLVAAVRQARLCVIASHANPDGDALGSSLGLALGLESIGKKVAVLNRDPVPDFYQFLPGSRRITSRVPAAARRGEGLLLLLDCNSINRVELDGLSCRHTAVIDHHETESDFGTIRWIQRNAAATGVMVHALLGKLRVSLTPAIATNLYTAISLDSGTFRYSNTTARLFRISADLVDAGADPAFVAESLYDSWSPGRFRLLLDALETLEMRDGLAIMHITREMFRRTGTSSADTENFSNFPRMVSATALSALFREIGNGTWKVSLRSKGNLNVAAIAERFGGGGHRNAAGYRTDAGLAAAKSRLRTIYRQVRAATGHPRPGRSDRR